MNIRKAKQDELDNLVQIWYDASIASHDFIAESFWDNNLKPMREVYLPMTENIVIEFEKEIVGFCALNGNIIEALFIKPQKQSLGFGKRLIHFVKEVNDSITLRVYKKNRCAILFYEKNGFARVAESIDGATQEVEIEMKWEKARRSEL